MRRLRFRPGTKYRQGFAARSRCFHRFQSEATGGDFTLQKGADVALKYLFARRQSDTAALDGCRSACRPFRQPLPIPSHHRLLLNKRYKKNGAPIAAIIPAAATSAALIYVGILMLQGLKNVNFEDMDQMVPVSLMLIGMPISGSIGHAIGIGLISYTIMKVFSGKAKDVSILTYAISALFLVKFFLAV